MRPPSARFVHADFVTARCARNSPRRGNFGFSGPSSDPRMFRGSGTPGRVVLAIFAGPVASITAKMAWHLAKRAVQSRSLATTRD